MSNIDLPAVVPENATEYIERIKHLDDEESAVALARQFSNSRDKAGVAIGCLLLRMEEEGWFGGHRTLNDFVAEEIGWKYRKAKYMMAIYKVFDEAGVDFSVIDSIGWSKCEKLVPILTSENKGKWLALAGEIGIRQLKEEVAEATSNRLPAEDSSDEGSSNGDSVDKKVKVSFNLHADQYSTFVEALRVGRESVGTEYDSVALDSILVAYLADGGDINPVELLAKACDGDRDKVLNTFVERFNILYPKQPLKLA